MKKFMFFAALCAALCANAFETTSYIKLADTIRVNPAERGWFVEVECDAFFDAPFDSWDVYITYSQGLSGHSAYQLEGTYIGYFDAYGDVQQYIVPLHVSNDISTIICESNVTTYWLVDGRWMPYRYAMWCPGEHKMFVLRVNIDPDFTDGTITLSSIMRKRINLRETEYTAESVVQSVVVLTDAGDINVDGEVNVADINALIDLVLTGAIDPKGDVNGDGEVSIADVSTLINSLL